MLLSRILSAPSPPPFVPEPPPEPPPAHGTEPEPHGGNRFAMAQQLGCRPEQLLDASASLVPFGPPWYLRLHLLARLARGSALRDYPDRSYRDLRHALAACHGLDPAAVLPGNGAAELFTWAARDAATCGLSLLPAPGFSDYSRALRCWGGAMRQLPLPLDWHEPGPLAWPLSPGCDGDSGGGGASVLWITNPHNPTGQLWSRASLEPLLERHALVIVDEAFLPLVPGGEQQSLVPLLPQHPQLVVIRSLTKLLAVAGLRLGYALAAPERLQRWARWRDPWPINGLAASLAPELLQDPRWLARVQAWVGEESHWLQRQLADLPELVVMPSAANFRLLRSHPQRGPASLEPLRQALATRHRILLRDCRSFTGLDGRWLRLSLLDRRGHRRLLAALQRELPTP
jgi:histidinol-phosphate/aromatic aminotransferase/cobyric acid decarboxylase-like protein